MTYRFNRQTFLSAEDLSIAFVESYEAFEMAKLHLRDQFIELWLKDIRDYDTLIFLKKLKEDLQGDLELIIIELLFYLNPERSFGLLGYQNLEISGLYGIIQEINLLQIKSPESSYLLNNLYNGRLSSFYQIYTKHSKEKDPLTEELLIYFSRKEFFNSIKPENQSSEYILKVVLKVIDVHLNPKIYCIHKSYFIDCLPYFPTIDEINILYKYFPEDLRNSFDILEQYNSKSGTTNRSSEEIMAEISLEYGTPAKFIQNFLIDFISKKISGFTAENWVIKIKNFLDENGFSFSEVFSRKKYLKFYLSGKWGVISIQDYKKIISNIYSDIKAFRIPQQNDFFLGKVSEEEWAILDHEGNLLSYSQTDDFTFSEEFVFRNYIIRPFDSAGKRITGIFNKNNERLYPFDEVYEPKEGFAITKTNGKYNFLSLEGRILLDSPVDNVTNFRDEFACVSINKKWGYINSLGEDVVVTKFSSSGNIPETLYGIVYNKVIKEINSSLKSHGSKFVLGTSIAAVFEDVSIDSRVESIGSAERKSTYVSVKSNGSLYKASITDKSVFILTYEDMHSWQFKNANSYSQKDTLVSRIIINGLCLEKEGENYYFKKDDKIFIPKLTQ